MKEIEIAKTIQQTLHTKMTLTIPQMKTQHNAVIQTHETNTNKTEINTKPNDITDPEHDLDKTGTHYNPLKSLSEPVVCLFDVFQFYIMDINEKIRYLCY